MSWCLSRTKVEATARSLTVADLAAQSGRLKAFCGSCNSWRRVHLDGLPEALTVVQIGKRLRCQTCRRRPMAVYVSDRFRNSATLKL